MLETLTNLIPIPIKDVIMAPIAARKNPNLAADRLIRSSIRITIAAIGVFSAYKLLGIFASSFLGLVASVSLPMAAVYIASMPAGDMMFGCTFLSFGTIGLITTLGLEALTLFQLSSNLLMAGMCIGFISVGVLGIHLSEERTLDKGFLGYLEPHITSIAKKYQNSVANFLNKF